MTPDEAQARAHEAYAQDPTITGTTLGELCQRSDGWGRAWLREHKAKSNGHRETPVETRQPAPAARRKPPVPAAVHRAAVVGVVVVAVIAALASYDHMRVLAVANGQGPISWVLPIAVDGLMLVASMVLLERRGAVFAWTALLLGVVVSTAANIASADDTALARAVSAWPPLFLLLSYELLLQLRNPRKGGRK